MSKENIVSGIPEGSETPANNEKMQEIEAALEEAKSKAGHFEGITRVLEATAAITDPRHRLEGTIEQLEALSSELAGKEGNIEADSERNRAKLIINKLKELL